MLDRRLSEQSIGLVWRLAWLWRRMVARLAALTIQGISRIAWLHWIPRRAVIPVERALLAVDGRGLFDPRFYSDHHPDVRQAGTDPLAHYLRDGWREGRAPNARFDDGHYRAEAGMVRGAPVSPLAHFLAFGHQQGLCPVPGVDLSAYAVRHPALQVARIDPYQLLLKGMISPDEARPPLAPVLASLADLRPPSGDAIVDIVVPVYRGHAETLNTLVHVLRARCRTPFEVVVIDDASPEPALSEDLRRLAARGLLRLLINGGNRGFVASTNRGTAEHPGRDVVWLNADTEVYDGWLDRLRAAAYSRPDAATVTPLTNNGTICSYPRLNADNPGELEIGWRAIDALAARENAGRHCVSPTAVGFATYVRRAALEALGPLDEQAFGRGYGEENDFSRRAVAAGWVNLVATDVVVRHFGATSFQGTRADRVEAALKVLDRRYPGYRAEVAEFLATDPLGPDRRALDLARLRRLADCPGRRNVLIVTHSRGGGTQQRVHEEIARLNEHDTSVFVMMGGAAGPGSARLDHAEAAALPALSALPLDDDALWQALLDFRIEEVQIHHLIDFGPAAAALFHRRLEAAGLPFTFMVHDYYPVCPRISMTDRMGHYCGEPDVSGCRRCLARRGAEPGAVDIFRWREDYRGLLADARQITVPDRDVADRLRGYFPEFQHVSVVPHEAPEQFHHAWPLAGRRGGPLRIAVIGSIGPQKGFDVVLGLARHLRSVGDDAQITVIGYTRDDETALAHGIAVTGPYLNAEADALVRKVDPDVIWIPSIWPETYCYTLSIALRSGRPVAAFAIGALSNRLRDVARGHLMPLEHARDPERLRQALRAVARPVGQTALAS